MTKTQRHEAIRERARRALRDLYHNATPDYPRDFGPYAEHFDQWLAGAAEFEVDYIQGGGAYGTNYRKTLASPANAGKLKSEQARGYYIAKGLRAMEQERADCGALTGWRVLELAAGNEKLARRLRKAFKGSAMTRNDAQWELIGEYGKLYQWGRGGRTLAPEQLIKQGGGSSFSIREDYADELPIADVVDLIRVVESFNRYVGSWCASVPEQWAEYTKERERDERAERQRQREEAREEVRRAILRQAFL